MRVTLAYVAALKQTQRAFFCEQVTFDNCADNLNTPVSQKDGPHNQTAQLEKLSSNDDNICQPVYANGRIWAGLNTALDVGTGTPYVGIAYYILAPSVSVSGGVPTVGARLEHAGVLSATNGNSVFFPAFAINKFGRGVMGFTLAGRDFYPSAAYVLIAQSTRTIVQSDIIVALAGAGPCDSNYAPDTPPFGPVTRWGDYFMGAADEQSNLWFEVEYVPARPSDGFENWGTAVVKVSASSIPVPPPTPAPTIAFFDAGGTCDPSSSNPNQVTGILAHDCAYYRLCRLRCLTSQTASTQAPKLLFRSTHDVAGRRQIRVRTL